MATTREELKQIAQKVNRKQKHVNDFPPHTCPTLAHKTSAKVCSEPGVVTYEELREGPWSVEITNKRR